MSDVWIEIDRLPPPGERPGRVFVVVKGFETHSGFSWSRRRIGIARTNNDGFYKEDIALIEKQDHMDDHSGVVTHWMPINLPPIPE